MFQRCLICTDFADGLYRFVEFVPSLAASGIKQIVFLHTVPLWTEGEIPRIDEEGILKASDRLRSGLKNIPEGIEVHVEVPSGRPLDTIPKVAQNYKSEVILTGMQSRSFLQEKLFGSTTAGLARGCARPLLILRPQLVSTYTCEELDLRSRHLFRYLLIPYDGSKAADYLVQKVKEYAQKRPDDSLQQCMLMWVIEEGGRRPVLKKQQLQTAQEKLEEIKAELEELDLQVHTEVREGNPYIELLDAATVFDISAIAISSNHMGSILEWPVGSFASELMRRSWHPVLFFPPQG
ncbi:MULTISPECIES: universal stress protein [unclassified Coleofasciculus]|uniref:universal stress protein n=1 Tax=unclassified Coleofasciculus TaxID=2692782 RepID=UPI00187E1D9C|nr:MULTISPECIES: universal stress protein [unclassified Coleofasciculus]MBE9127800.1 universal stress protein [Coleofasciculus sp. LEGE 07081]MBE9150041.1 universal stress protein [Coleofasciculus sp. LEGE 07092]